jgi:hypothetical protein
LVIFPGRTAAHGYLAIVYVGMVLAARQKALFNY